MNGHDGFQLDDHVMGQLQRIVEASEDDILELFHIAGGDVYAFQQFLEESGQIEDPIAIAILEAVSRARSADVPLGYRRGSGQLLKPRRPNNALPAQREYTAMPNDYTNLDFKNVWIDNFHFIKRLGSGGYASVWLADECTNREVIRQVAIKVFVDDFNDRDSFNQTFANFRGDLQYLADLAPANPIVQYHGHLTPEIRLEDDGTINTLGSRPPALESSGKILTLFLVIMEYGDGGHLGSTYREQVVENTLNYRFLDHFIDICTALQAAHSEEIIHRDIKPHNILWFRKQNRVKVADFGIAEHIRDTAFTGSSIRGSLPYMSPESFDTSIPAAPPRDIYALGCTLYEILVGEPAIHPSYVHTTLPHYDSQISLYEFLHKNLPRPDAALKAPPEVVSIALSALLKEMMDVSAAKRPPLSHVVEALSREKSKRVDTFTMEERTERIVIPTTPQYLSDYQVNPRLHIDHLKNSLFFCFFRMPVKSQYYYKTLLALLERDFYDTYSFCEVFGHYDYLVRVWAPNNRDRITRFCNALREQVLNGDANALRIMACEDVRYLSTQRRVSPSQKLDLVEVQVHLRAAQIANDTEAIKWLKRRRIFLRQLPQSIAGAKLLCFCLITNPNILPEAEREARWAVLLQRLQSDRGIVTKRAVSLYRKAYRPVEQITNEVSDFLVAYVAKDFNDIISVPGFILESCKEFRFETRTLIATKRFFVDSERIRIT